MAADARPPQPTQECCVRSGNLWDMAAVYPKGVRWEDRMPLATVFDGPVVEMTDAIKAALSAMRTGNPTGLSNAAREPQ